MALGKDARSRLATAVRTLLDSPGLEEAADPVRLAVVVLASRTPSETGVVEIRARELGRWLGLSVSRVRHAVVPGLRRSGVVDVEILPGEFGEDGGLTCRVLPMWEAQNTVGHPLRLTKPELATLLRLMEALMAPGWAHRDGKVTPAGLLGARTGHAAATDRLALLLLVLQAGETGRVRLCGGRVDTRYGRPVATLARLLGGSLSQAERALGRLEGAGLVERPRRQTVSGMRQASRLVVPAVSAAHGGRQGTARGADGSVGDLAGTAWPSADSLPPTNPQVSEVHERCGRDEGDLAATASLHTDHSSMADVSSDRADGLGFSGDAGTETCGRPERAYAHEGQTADAADVSSERALGGRGPLRGDNQRECPGGGSPTKGSRGPSQPRIVDGADGRQQRMRRVTDLGDLRLQVALAPVAYLWRQLRDGQQVVAARAAERALEALAGLVDAKAAPRALAARLTDRLQEVGGEALVRDPMGWLLGRGLVQRPACPDLRCDDGIRLDTGADCPTCATIVHTRRALRTRVAAVVEAEMPCGDPASRRAEAERRLREETALEEQRAQIRRARAEREVEQRQQAIARLRALEEVAELARTQAPCADCGLPESAGLCPVCSYRRRTEALVREAVDLAVAVRADLLDAAAVAELTLQCEADTRTLMTLACKRACGPDADPGLVAFAAPQVAQRIRDERREAALRWLLGSEEAMAEADAVYEACLRRYGRGAERAAEQAADEAGRRAAVLLLRQRLSELNAVRRRSAVTVAAA
ncbi:hypothetical protein ACF07Y_39375 [Streptomyces sp. NPDC016566]|uniref:hypothetical protein n=1 Tax=Streptomyces sp. NPDC016566 TaxID=3364967 RepID=UPI0036FC95C2